MTDQTLVIDGRPAWIGQDCERAGARGWYITDDSSCYYLNHDGEWQDGVSDAEGNVNGFWPTREAALAFLNSLAGKQPSTIDDPLAERLYLAKPNELAGLSLTQEQAIRVAEVTREFVIATLTAAIREKIGEWRKPNRGNAIETTIYHECAAELASLLDLIKEG